MTFSKQAQKRWDDAIDLAVKATDMSYADAVLDRLREAELFESVPIGATTEGGGVLITGARLRYELEAAYLAGQASTL